MIATSHKRSWISYAGSLPASEGPRKGVDRGRRQNGWPPLSGWVSSRPLDLRHPPPPLSPPCPRRSSSVPHDGCPSEADHLHHPSTLKLL